MKLSELFNNLQIREKVLLDRNETDPDLARLEYDSRRVACNNSRNGSFGGVIYSCVKGDTVDGHDFASDAVRAGAAALLCEREMPVDVPQIITARTRATMGEASALLYGAPRSNTYFVLTPSATATTLCSSGRAIACP